MNLGREDKLAGGTLSCTSELETAARLHGIVDELETLIARVKDTHIIGNIGREDDHAVGSRSCTRELEIAAQLCGDVDELETLVARIEETLIIDEPRARG